MNLLTISHLFPNLEEPFKGVFVGELVGALAVRLETQVLAPISRFPILRPAKKLNFLEKFRECAVYHPRYLALPKVMLDLRWRPYYRAVRRTMEGIRFTPDVVHAHWLYPDGMAAVRWAGLQGIPTVVTIHGHASLGLGKLGLQTPLCHETLHATDGIITVSQELKAILVRSFNIASEKIRVIHNGVDISKFPQTSQEDARRRLGLALNRRIILCVARLSPEKQLDRLIEAISMCKTERVQAFFVGVGPLREDLGRKIEEMELQNRIILAGGIRHETLSDWYYAADLFCLSSAHEGCPVVIQEALACGLPVVSTSVGAVPEIVRHGENGLIVAADQESIALAIDESFQRPWNRNEIATEGRQQTWKAVADKTIDVYDEFIDSDRLDI